MQAPDSESDKESDGNLTGDDLAPPSEDAVRKKIEDEEWHDVLEEAAFVSTGVSMLT